MKKILSMLLALSMVLSLCAVPAWAKDAERYKVTYSSSENGTIKAFVSSVNMENGETVEAEIASGDMVDRNEKLIFSATPDPGYKVKGWTLDGEATDTVVISEVTDKTGWTYNTNTGSQSVSKAFDGIIGTNNYWHSGYVIVLNPITGKYDTTVPEVDINETPFFITAIFDDYMTIPEIALTYRLGGFGSQRVKDYKVWGTYDGENFEELLAEGTLDVKTTEAQTIYLADEKPILGIKFEILTINAGGPHCTISEITLMEKTVVKNELKGSVINAGTASQNFEIEDLFTDAEVYVEFERDLIIGDLTGDESVDISDALLLFRHSLMPDRYTIDYEGDIDFTNDGSVDVTDAVLLFRHSLMPDLYPIS